MVIPTGTSFERTNLSLLDNEFQTGNSKWSERRLQHRFLVLKKLGQGTYGKVQLALNKETNQEVAIKTIKKARIESEEDMLRIRREIYIMKSICHPYIIHIHEVFETRLKIVIVMQYASGGELYDYLGCHNTLPEEEARRIFRQIASAIYYCHKNNICHRDLKLENILLDDVGNAQIADFGLSNIFDDRRRMNTFCGSPLYASPEIVKGTPYKGPEVDCWSLGVLLYTLIYGTMPFDGRNFKDLVSQISEGRYEEPANKSSASSLIRRLLTPDISRRATISDVCRDIWVNEGYNSSLLNVAEKMAWDVAIKTKNVSLTKFAFETNGHGSINSPATIKKSNDTIPPENSMNGRNCALYEQIVNYDVSFIINKLLVAVESSVTKSETPSNPISSFKTPNGETNGASKVAYVIPIFEVTSVVPKNNKMVKNRNCEENSEPSKKALPNGVIHTSSEAIPKREVKKKLMIQRKEVAKLGTSKDLNDTNEHLKQSLPIIKITESNISKATNDMLQIKKVINRENSFSRIPSVKTRRANENFKFASKHLGPFFRTTNHALSLARLFSLKYEKRTAIRSAPMERKKLPGKIVIPSTFDPSTTPNVYERKPIVLFPTVSVSENKETIEKKIDKIKKAALNRNLIKRSSSKNRLKIQKYLLSQAKKIQDLICDEQRCANGSMEQLNTVRPNLSEAFHYQFEKGNINCVRQHNKRINFVYPNTDHCSKNETFDFTRMTMFPMRHLSAKKEYDLRLFTLAKSKSDVQFPSHFSNSNESHDSSIRSNSLFNKYNVHTLGIPVSDCNTRLQRSASDSEGLNIFRSTFQNDEYEEYYNNDTNGMEVSYKKSLIYGHSPKAANKSDFQDSIQSIEEFNTKTFKNSFKANESYNDRNGANKTILRSNSICVCEGLENANSNYIMNHLSCLPTSEKRCIFSNQETAVVTKVKSFQSALRENQCELATKKRRNSLDSKVFSDVDKMYHFKRTGEGILNNSTDNHLWTAYQEQLTHPKNEDNFFNSNLYPLEKINSNDNKSIDNLSFRANVNSDFYTDSMHSLPPSAHKSSKTSAFLRRILQESNNYENIGNDFLASSPNRAKSISEDTFSSDESSNILRKLSMGIIGGQNKTPFLSKFLNNLENREQNANLKNSSVNHRRYFRNPFSPGKRPKLEKKSFLQLLSLKRIQEAEKELDKAQRNAAIDAEESSAGSLLEALKTHGYKGVISQLFQGTDSNSFAPLNGRKTDIARYNVMYYDSLPQLSSPDYDRNLLAPYETYAPSYKQKQLVCDWLSQNLEHKTPFEEPICETMVPTEVLKLDDNPPESPEASNLNASLDNESDKSIPLYSDPLSYPKTEKNPLLRASSTSEDEREESVQDRIWRKSFYSRFNNSALSRKERSAFLEMEFPPESRTGFNGVCASPFKVTHRERSDSVKWNSYNKDLQSKRVHTARKYSLVKDSSAANCGTKLSKQNSYENTSSNETLTKWDDLEPDH